MQIKKRKTIIVGAGLGGLVHGILLKKARPEDIVVIYDSNNRPGGFCSSFQKTVYINKEEVKYNINIPLITSDFGENEPFDLFLKYIGIENIKWDYVSKIFQYYPLNGKPFLFTNKNGARDLLKLTNSKKEKKKLQNFLLIWQNFIEIFFIGPI